MLRNMDGLGMSQYGSNIVRTISIKIAGLLPGLSEHSDVTRMIVAGLKIFTK